MTSEDSQPQASGWLERELPDSGRRPRKRELALALRILFRLLKTGDSVDSACRPPTQAQVAKRLHSNPTSVSRFASLDPRVPSQSFVEDLHKQASRDAALNGQDVGVALERLLTLRALADAEHRGRCQSCVELGRRIDSLTRQLNMPCPSCAAYQREQEEGAAQLIALRNELTTIKARAHKEVQMRESAEAGLRACLAAAKAQAPLPVPPRRRDRQRSKKEVAVARQLAEQAGELDSAGKQYAALAILRQGTTELLSPTETAMVMVELREGSRDRLANELIHVYGRDQEDRQHVMAVALELHEEGAVDDAGAVLRAALK